MSIFRSLSPCGNDRGYGRFSHNALSMPFFSQMTMNVWVSTPATLRENVSTSTVDFFVGVTVAILEMEWRIAQVLMWHI